MAAVAAAIAWAVLFTVLAFQLHAGMRTHKADLGQVAQAVWNSSRGRFVEQTDNGFLATRLTDHVEPILALISPILWVWEDTRALLLLQVLFVAAGTWFIYDLALLRMGRALSRPEWQQIWRRDPFLSQARPLAFVLAVAWLLAPQIQSAVLTEFHAVPLAAPLILWALWAIEVRRWKQFSVAALLVASVKEETALLAALLGMWAIWQAWRQSRDDAADRSKLPSPQAPTAAALTGDAAMARRLERPPTPGVWWGGSVAILSLLWFVLATFVIVPRHAVELYGVAESGYFARYGALGDSPTDIARSFFTQPRLVWQILTEPARLEYLWGLVATFALLPLLAPELLLLSLPVLLANVLSAYPAQYYGEFHYSAPLVPYVGAAAAFGIGRLWGWIWRRTQAASPAFQHLPASSAGAMAAAAFVRNPGTALRPLLTVALFIWVGAWATGLYMVHGRGPGAARHDPTPITEHHQLLPGLAAQIPRDAPVTATAAVHPHLAMRRFVYQFPLGLETTAPSLPAEWALLDVTTNTDMAPGDLLAQVEAMLATGWSVVDARDGFLLLRQGEGSTTIPAAFYTFTMPDNTATALISLEDWPRWRQTRLVAVWPQGEPALSVQGVSGETIYTLGTATPPALLWRAQGIAAGTLPANNPARAVTPALTLPRSVLVDAGNGITGNGETAIVLRRTTGDRLLSVPAGVLESQDYAQRIGGLSGYRLRTAESALPVEPLLSATIRVEDRPTWPGDTVDVWVQWRGSEWPAAAAPAIELHHNGQSVVSDTGAPRLFGRDQAGQISTLGYANDWRMFALPADRQADGNWSINLIAADGSILATLPLDVRPFVPDQTCALVPPACASQPR